MRPSDPSQVMRSGQGPVVPVIRLPGIQTAHPAKTLNGDSGETGVPFVSQRSVGSGDVQQRLAEWLSKSRRQGEFRHAVKADVAGQNKSWRNRPGVAEGSDLGALIGRAAAIPSGGTKVERLKEIILLDRPFHPYCVILALVPVNARRANVLAHRTSALVPNDVERRVRGDDPQIDVRFRDQLIESHGAGVQSIRRYHVNLAARGENASARAVCIAGCGVKYHPLTQWSRSTFGRANRSAAGNGSAKVCAEVPSPHVIGGDDIRETFRRVLPSTVPIREEKEFVLHDGSADGGAVVVENAGVLALGEPVSCV